jgi:P-type Cu+ transporter
MGATGTRLLLTLAACAALALAGCGRQGEGNSGVGIAYAEPTRVAVRVEWSAEPASPQPGQPVTLRYRLRDARSGQAVADLTPDHDEAIQLFAVSADLASIARVDAERAANGDYAATFTPPRAGRYRLYAEFRREGRPALDRRELLVGGGGASAAPALRLDRGPVAVGGATLQLLAPQTINAGAATPLTLEISRDGQRVADLERYLGAAAHMLILSADGLTFAHVDSTGVDTHADEDRGPSSSPAGPFGPRVGFAHVFPAPGSYRIWVEFRRAGRVEIAPFVVEIGR